MARDRGAAADAGVGDAGGARADAASEKQPLRGFGRKGQTN